MLCIAVARDADIHGKDARDGLEREDGDGHGGQDEDLFRNETAGDVV